MCVIVNHDYETKKTIKIVSSVWELQTEIQINTQTRQTYNTYVFASEVKNKMRYLLLLVKQTESGNSCDV